MSTILGIWAHPDDEVFVSGGLMADAVRRGDRVVCVHMTSGEAGLYFRRSIDPDSLEDVRRHELRASLDHIGVTEQHFFGYPDGALDHVPADEAITRICNVLAIIKPDEIVTFGPDGFTGNPDHTVLSEWVSAAFKLWNKPGTRVYHSAMSSEWKDSFVAPLDEFEMFWPGHPLATNDSDLTLSLHGTFLDAKVEAIRAHASQMSVLFDAYGDAFMRALAAEESFVLAHTGPGVAQRSFCSQSQASKLRQNANKMRVRRAGRHPIP
jgi:LmbE family N-acetylglucosaminyl deacetylase